MAAHTVKVSVVIAAYNAEPCLDRACRSALTQTGVDVEVIIVDDRSTDDTVRIARALERDDQRVRLVELPSNGGPSRARNAGIDAATGEWVAVLDADDAYLPGRLEALASSAAAHGADLIADNFYFYNLAAQRRSKPALAQGPNRTLDLEAYLAGTRPYGHEADFGLLKPMFRREFLDTHELRYPAEVRHGEDFELIVRCLLAGGRYVVLTDPYYLYTTRDSGLSRTEIDYGGQIARTARLRADPLLRARRQARRELTRRIAALRRLDFDRLRSGTRTDGDRLRYLALLLTNIQGWAVILRRIRTSLR